MFGGYAAATSYRRVRAERTQHLPGPGNTIVHGLRSGCRRSQAERHPSGPLPGLSAATAHCTASFNKLRG